ncbi:hypothetical protein VCR31J2_1370089 [Vibrio coralliirubri]|uniref:Uncharacterized protein n=1 Tax=Vibrio coralliirubri TaxID=1516159 RepID=A0AA86XPA1_9VIBR|nr:hypothetical protein VCR31J2_1370089 [Vibrio coralliirubri]
MPLKISAHVVQLNFVTQRVRQQYEEILMMLVVFIIYTNVFF